VTLGPFHSVPPTLGYGKAEKATQEPFSVHYETKEPVLGIRQLRRSAEVSHWGANLNIQDDISLFNNGPA
jgi:oligosaccharyltransferase complex subunit alpha (ribophorin I)